jgi:heme-degrading monooxygenase HmoA
LVVVPSLLLLNSQTFELWCHCRNLFSDRGKTSKEVSMAVKVFIKRYVKKGKTDAALELLKEVRAQALKQPGYISGETLVNHYDPCNITVLSTWQTIDDWIQWQESDERSGKEDQLEGLQEGPTHFEIYDVGPPAVE